MTKTDEKHQVREEILDHLTLIHTLTPHPRNARRGNIEDIKQSLTTHGQYKPIIIQASTGYIVAGNHTWQAAIALGWTHIAAIHLGLDDDQATRLLLIDNRTSDIATYDDQALAELLQDIEKTGTFTGTGYDEDDLEELLKNLADKADDHHDDDEPLPARTGLIECPECGHIWRADTHGDPV